MGWREPKGDLKAVSSPSWEVYKWVPEDSSLSPKAELFPLTFHRLVTSLDATLQGTYQVTVQAQDKPSVGPALEANITLNVSFGPCLQPWCPLPAPGPLRLIFSHAPSIALHCGSELPRDVAVLDEQGGGGRQHEQD